MNQDPRSNNAYRIAILVIVIVLLPVAFIAFRLVFARLATPTVTATSVSTVPAGPVMSSDLPVSTFALHRTKAGLEVTVGAENRSSSPITTFSLDKLEVEGIPVITGSDLWAGLPGHGKAKKVYRISKTFAGKTEAMVEYSFEVKLGTTGSSSSGGGTLVTIK